MKNLEQGIDPIQEWRRFNNYLKISSASLVSGNTFFWKYNLRMKLTGLT